MRIDDQNIKPCSEYNFSFSGYHIVYFLIDNNIDSLAYMFNGINDMILIKFTNKFDSQKITNMEYMFDWCSSLKSIDLSNLNTENVLSMESMFREYNLESLNLSNFNTKNVENMGGMFSQCTNLISLDISSFNTQNVIYLNSMFSYCEKITSLNLSNFNLGKAIYINDMFNSCFNLRTIDLFYNTHNIQNMDLLFYCCTNLLSVDLSGFNLQNVWGMNQMFSFCNKITSINLSNININQEIYIEHMFQECNNLQFLDLSSFNENYMYISDNLFYNIRNNISCTLIINKSFYINIKETIPTNWIIIEIE